MIVMVPKIQLTKKACKCRILVSKMQLPKIQLTKKALGYVLEMQLTCSSLGLCKIFLNSDYIDSMVRLNLRKCHFYILHLLRNMLTITSNVHVQLTGIGPTVELSNSALIILKIVRLAKVLP